MKNNKLCVLLMFFFSSVWAAEIPLLDLSPIGLAQLQSEKTTYAEFYALLNVDSFMVRLKGATNEGSLPSTLYRPDVNGESTDRLFQVISTVKALPPTPDLTVLIPIMKDLVSLFSVMDSTATVFIPKALKSCANFIKMARSGQNVDQYTMAEAILKGTIENLNSFISYFDSFGQFLGDFMKSQKQRFLLAASKCDLTGQLSDGNLFSTVSQCDFSIDRLQQKFRNQLDQAYTLKSLIPQTADQASLLLDQLSNVIEDPSPPRKRSLSRLVRVSSKREVKAVSSDAISRGDPAGETSSEATSPKTPRGKSRK